MVANVARQLDRSRLPAGIFNDAALFELERERERIFARSWIYIAHESEIPDPGDYVVRYSSATPSSLSATRSRLSTPC